MSEIHEGKDVQETPKTTDGETKESGYWESNFDSKYNDKKVEENSETEKAEEDEKKETSEAKEEDEDSKEGKRADRLPKTGGKWDGEPGNSKWTMDREHIPGDCNGTNPDHKSWGEICDQYKVDSINFKDNNPDFSEISKGNVEIENFKSKRNANFVQADMKLAEQRGCDPSEVSKWRADNRYTWHECPDCKSMQKVPTEVHGNIPHTGGVSRNKAEQS